MQGKTINFVIKGHFVTFSAKNVISEVILMKEQEYSTSENGTEFPYHSMDIVNSTRMKTDLKHVFFSHGFK